MSTNFVNVQPLFSFFEDRSNINHLFEKMNALIMHTYEIFCMYYLLLNQDFEDWAKARSTTGTWYSQFLMILYNDKKWIEHFQMNKSFVR
jgi:hypothetical protein